MDLVADNIEQLKQLFPEVITEGPNGQSIDFDHLRRLLGDQVEDSEERFGLTWHGKARAKLIAQRPSTGTLRPMVADSVNWGSTQNLFIEGDNLEVLKLLQKSYHQQVKMIYIDPPYNTGKEFIYPDKFDDNLDTYLRYTGQKDADGRSFGTNTETSGRYHTNWLNMMYPRLKLARNLLREDGCIFISIDDHEVDNLRLVCDEIFGESNFIATVIWHKMDSPKNSAVYLSEDHDYVLLYAKNADVWRPKLLPRSKEMVDRYKNPDNDPRGPWLLSDLAARNAYSKGRYPITTPSGRTIKGPPAGSYWRISREKFDELDSDGRIWWGDSGDNRPGIKKFLSEVRDGVVPQTYWHWKDVGSTRNAKQELSKLLNAQASSDLFETPKPTGLVRRMLKVAASDGDLVMDFFAGSGTTAHATMLESVENKLSVRCIQVQLPEPAGNGKTIANQCANRMIQAGNSLKGKLGDPGFRWFRLDATNFLKWSGGYDDLVSATESLKPDRSDLDIVFEILLKTGLDLSLAINEHNIASQTVYEMGAGALIVCLAHTIDLDLVEGIGALHDALEPEVCRVVFRDAGFADDATKTNAVQILKRHGIEDVKSL